MDMEMDMEKGLKNLSAKLLQEKLYRSFRDPQRRKQHLINCLRRQGLILEDIPVMSISQTSPDVCKICNSSSIISSNHESICQQCGATDTSISFNPFKTYKQNINFSRGTFIEPGTTFVSVIKDGKEVRRDLSKVNTWISNDPEETKINRDMKKLDVILDNISLNYDTITFEKVKLEIFAMWYNILTLRQDLRGITKQALMVLSVYYPMVYNKLSISIQRLASMTGIVNVGDIYSHNFILKDLFKNTNFQNYISIPIGTVSKIQIPNEILLKVDKIKSRLKDRLSDPLKDKELYGIIYYIARELKIKGITLVYLAAGSGLSQVTISKESSKIESFFNQNPYLKSIIF